MLADHADGCSNNNAVVALDVRGPLDRPALMEAVRLFVRRHEVLRTTLVRRHGQVQQRIGLGSTVEVGEVDIGFAGRRERSGALDDLIVAEQNTPFRIHGGDLARVTLVRLARTHHVLIVNLHHAIIDGWSVQIVVRDVSRLYAGVVAGERAPLPPLSVQFGDYAAWEQAFSDRAAETYWSRHLESPPAPLRLPIDPAWRAADGYVTTERPIPELSAPDVDRLDELVTRAKATMPMALAAVAACLLAPYSDGRMSLGIVAANRERRELQPVLGCVASLWPLLVELTPGMSFVELLEDVRDRFRARRDQPLPMGALHRLLGPGDHHLYDVTLNSWAASPPTRLRLEGRSGLTVITERPVSRDALRMIETSQHAGHPAIFLNLVRARRGSVHGRLIANERAFPPPTTQRIGSELVRFARLVAAEPGRSIEALHRAPRSP